MGQVYDSNQRILLDAVAELGGEPLAGGVLPDDASRSRPPWRPGSPGPRPPTWCCSPAGTSKGEGDLNAAVVHRLARRLPGSAGVVVHGVALKPGKPLLLAVIAGKPVVVLPGFPTSAIFTFQEFVAPLVRRLAGARRGGGPAGGRGGPPAHHLGAGADRVRPRGPGGGPPRARRLPAGCRVRGASPPWPGPTASCASRPPPSTSRVGTGAGPPAAPRGAAGRPGGHRQPLRGPRLPPRPARRAGPGGQVDTRRAPPPAWPPWPGARATWPASTSSTRPPASTTGPSCPRAWAWPRGYGRRQGLAFRRGDPDFDVADLPTLPGGGAPRRAPHGEPQPGERDPRAARPPPRRGPARRATPTSRAPTTPWPPPWRRAEPTGG